MERSRCSYCQVEIKGHRLQCTECADISVCLRCFSCGAEIASHSREHSYVVKDEQGLCIFEENSKWSQHEENLLLDAIEQFGFGNWFGTAAHIGSRTPSECAHHYKKFYVGGLIGDVTLQDTPCPSITDHTNINGALAGPLSPSLTIPISPVDVATQQQQELGYMPLRDDFEREYDNDAEMLISGLSVSPEDDEIGTAILLAQVDNYRLRLQDRDRQKRVAREYGLITAGVPPLPKTAKTPYCKKKSGKPARDLQEKLKPFSKFHTIAEHHLLLEHFKREKEIKTRMKELLRWRKNGITKLSDGKVYEEEKCKRNKRRESKKKLVMSSFQKQNSQVFKKARGKPKKMAMSSSIEKEEKTAGKDSIGSSWQPRIEVNSEMPGFKLLSENERKLCNSMGISPATYITVKACIIKDYLQKGNSRDVGKINFPGSIDRTYRHQILRFIQDNFLIGVC